MSHIMVELGQIYSWISQCFHWNWKSLGWFDVVKLALHQPDGTLERRHFGVSSHH